MYKRILIATDGSELAGRAVAHGLALAKEVKAPVTLVTVTQPWSALELAHEARLGSTNPINQFEDMAAASAKAILDAAAQKAKAAGVACDLVHVPDQHPAEGIIATAGPDRDGVARPQGRRPPSARQPSERSARAQQGAHADRAMTWRPSASAPKRSARRAIFLQAPMLMISSSGRLDGDAVFGGNRRQRLARGPAACGRRVQFGKHLIEAAARRAQD